MNSKPEKWARKEELWPLLVEAVSVYNVLPLTSTCNLNCIFCSHLQNPPGIKAYHFPPLPLEELKQLIPFPDGSRKIKRVLQSPLSLFKASSTLGKYIISL